MSDEAWTNEDGFFAALKGLRAAAEYLESQEQFTPGTHDHAKVMLAWHHIMHAHRLMIVGELAPGDVVWGAAKAAQIIDTNAGRRPFNEFISDAKADLRRDPRASSD